MLRNRAVYGHTEHLHLQIELPEYKIKEISRFDRCPKGRYTVRVRKLLTLLKSSRLKLFSSTSLQNLVDVKRKRRHDQMRNTSSKEGAAVGSNIGAAAG
jgi:hypothetical protein